MRNIITQFVGTTVNLLLTSQNGIFVRFFEDEEEKELYRESQRYTLKQIIEIPPHLIESARFTDLDGTVISSAANWGSLNEKNKQLSTAHQPLYSKILALKKGEVLYDSPVISHISGKLVIPAATPVFSSQGSLYGVLFANIYLDGVTQSIRNISAPEDTILIVDEQGNTISHSGRKIDRLAAAGKPGDHPSFSSVLKNMMGGEGGNKRIVYEGKPSLITYRGILEDKLNRNTWSICIITDEAAIYAGASAGKYILLIFAASIGLFGIAGVLGKWVSKPINELTLSSLAMSQGDLSSRVVIERRDEIGQLANTFNAMASSFQTTHQELLKLSVTDGLTGLSNHREFQKRLKDEVRRATRYDSCLSLLMIDIDCFKKFNDAYGHQAGDTVLRMVGDVILKEVRSSDFAARYGGEEMAIILPETSSEEAYLFSERLRKDIEQISVKVIGEETVQVTVSAGVASFSEDAADRESLINSADEALYYAKKTGRNKTILYRETTSSYLEHSDQAAVKQLEGEHEWLFKDLSTAIESRLPFNKGHFGAVCNSAMQIAKLMNLPNKQIHELRIAANLYESGALYLPAQLLRKQGPLSEEEWMIIKRHPEQGVNLLSKILEIKDVLPVILHHHERYDGTGYPSGLKGKDIPLLSRIIGVVEAYYSMTSASPYRKRMTEDEAINELKMNSGTQFDPGIVEVLVNVMKDTSQFQK